MRQTYLTSLAIAVLIVGWLVSGQIGREEPPPLTAPTQAVERRAAMAQDRPLSRVRARVVHASPQVQSLSIRGKTENKRTVQVRAELTGTIVERPIERGSQVQAGDPLCRISVDDRQAKLAQAEEAVNEARIEYEGRLQLKAKGYLSETAIAQAKAKLAASRAELSRNQLDLAKTLVSAPFNGVVEEVHQEVGDYVTPGSPCATVVDLDPMLLVGRVSELDVQNVAVGREASGTLSDGRIVVGSIGFVGQQSDPATRTYRIEIPIANADSKLRSGITAEISVPVAQVFAHRISPALFALDDNGVVGVRTVGDDGRVQFHAVEIIREHGGGVWVSGLPSPATLITVGQEMVVPGEQVAIDFEPAREMPAKAGDPKSGTALFPEHHAGRS